MAAATQTLNRPFPPRNNQPLPPPLLGSRPRLEPIVLEKTCPLLLRVFTKIGSHHSEEDFAVRGKEPKDEVQIYTWKDANLHELTDLVKEVAPEARRRNAKLSFAFVYPDKCGHFVLRQLNSSFFLLGNFCSCVMQLEPNTSASMHTLSLIWIGSIELKDLLSPIIFITNHKRTK